MNKLLATLIGGLFATSVYAQTPATPAIPATPAVPASPAVLKAEAKAERSFAPTRRQRERRHQRQMEIETAMIEEVLASLPDAYRDLIKYRMGEE